MAGIEIIYFCAKTIIRTLQNIFQEQIRRNIAYVIFTHFLQHEDQCCLILYARIFFKQKRVFVFNIYQYIQRDIVRIFTQFGNEFKVVITGHNIYDLQNEYFQYSPLRCVCFVFTTSKVNQKLTLNVTVPEIKIFKKIFDYFF